MKNGSTDDTDHVRVIATAAYRHLDGTTTEFEMTDSHRVRAITALLNDMTIERRTMFVFNLVRQTREFLASQAEDSDTSHAD